MPIKLHVEILVPDEAPKEFDLQFSGPQVTLGRDRSNDVHVALSTLSRRHARIFERDRQWFIEDLESRHGTRVNGEPLERGGKKLLHDGDRIEFSHVRVIVNLLNEESIPDFSDAQTSVVARKMMRGALDEQFDFRDSPYLLMMSGPSEGKRFELRSDAGEVIIGRGEECQIHVDDTNVSRRHASIKRNWDEVWIEDLGSKNGIFVSGRRIDSPFRLTDGDEIQIGAVRFTFVDPESQILNKLSSLPVFEQQREEEEEEGTTVVSEGQEKPSPALDKKPAEKKIPAIARAKKSRFGTAELALIAAAGVLLVGLITGLFFAIR